MGGKTMDIDVEAQRMEWVSMRKHFTHVLENLANQEIVESYKQLFQVNIILGEKLLANLVLKCQYDVRRVALLVSMIDLDLAEFSELIAKESMIRFIYYFGKKNYDACFRQAELLSQLFNYGVIHEIIILQALQLLTIQMEQSKANTETRNVSVDIMITLFMNCGAKLLEVSKTMHNAVLEQLRQLMQSNQELSNDVMYRLDRLFMARQKQYCEIPEQIILQSPFEINEDDKNLHMFIVDDEFSNKQPDFKLDAFKGTKDYTKIEAKYKSLRFHIVERINESEEAKKTDENILTIHNMTNDEQIDFKKKIYLTLKSSLSGDEAAHKLLRLRIPDKNKSQVADILVKSMIQESTYSKFYGTLSDKLLGSHWTWKGAFETIFYETLTKLDELEPNQLRNCGKYWGHLLSSDLLGFEIFEKINMTEEGSSPPLRIFVKFLFQEMIFEIGIENLKARLDEDYIQPYLKNIFPKTSPEDIRYSINYFTAIGIGILTEDMRKCLDIIEAETEVEVEEEEDDDEDAVVKDEEEEKNFHVERVSRYGPHQGNSQRNRSVTPPRRQDKRRRSVTPPRRQVKRRERSITPPRRSRG